LLKDELSNKKFNDN